MLSLSLQRITRGISSHFIKRLSSSTATATAKSTSESVDVNNETNKERRSLVAAAFESLKEENLSEDSKNGVLKTVSKSSSSKEEENSINEKLLNAKTVNGLLSAAETSGPLTRKDALKIVSILAEWSSMERVKLSDFESDSRFIKICRILGRTVPKNGKNAKTSGYRTDDLNTVLSIAGDDEAAKLIASISVPQMVKVMVSLAQKKRRSTPLLRSLAYNISSTSDSLDLKQCSDVLYAMASLNFPDSVLTAKICADLLAIIPKHTEKSAVIGSILTSLGLLRYRDLDVLEALTKWVSKNLDVCRPQDISSLFLTLGTLNCKSADIESLKPELVNSLNESDFSKKMDLLNHVWALSLIKFANDKHIKLVLSPNFLEELKQESSETGFTPNAKLKLLNINAYAKLILKNFEGPFLSLESEVYSVPLAHNKSKQILSNGMLDALKSLFPSTTCLKSLVDSKMGFLIDAQCALDSKRNPLSLEKEHENAIKIAIMVVDFHDTCHGPHRSVTGLTNLCFDLLEQSGYKILPVLYTEFSTSDKLLKRVQYLETSLKNIVKLSN